MIDLPLIAIALAVIAIIAVVSFFLLFGNRERSFEDALAERKGLNILLSGNADDHKKTTSKDQRKKLKTNVTTRKVEQKAKSEEPKSEHEAGEEAKQQRVSEETLNFSAEIRQPIVNAIDTPSFSESESIDKSINRAKKVSAKKSDKTTKQPDVAEIKGTLQEQPQINGSVKTAKSILVEEFTQKVANPPVEQVLTLKSVANDQAVDNSVGVSAEAAKKKKPKPTAKTDKTPSKSPELGVKFTKGSDVADDEISINATLRRLNLPTLSETQHDVIAEFYSNNGPWATKPFSKSGAGPFAGPAAEIVSVGQLKKQIEEKDALLAKESQKLASTSHLLMDAKQEALPEKERSAVVEKSLKDKLTSMQSELHSLTQKLADYQSQMTSKAQAYRQMEAQLLQFRLEQNNMAQLQQENQRIKERLSTAEQEILTRNSELQRLKQEIVNRDSQNHRLEQQRKENEQIRALQEAGVSKQLIESHEKYLAKEKECNLLNEEVKVLKNEFSLLEQDHQILRHQLKDQDNHLHQVSFENDARKELEICQKELEDMRSLYNAAMLNQPHVEELKAEMHRQLLEAEGQFNQLTQKKNMEIEKLSSQLNSLLQELSNLKQQSASADQKLKNAEDVMNANGRLQSEIIQLRSELQSALHRLNEKAASFEIIETELSKTKQSLSSAQSTVEKLTSDLESAKLSSPEAKSEQVIEQMQQQIDYLDTTLSRRNSAIDNMEAQIKEQMLKSQSLEQELISLRSSYALVKAENEALTQINEQCKAQQTQQGAPVQNGVDSEIPGVVVDPDILKASEGSIAQLNKQLINKETELVQLKEQIESLRDKNFALRSEKYKAVEAVQKLEKNVKEAMEKTEAKFKDEIVNIQKQTRAQLTHLLPDGKKSSAMTYFDWLRECEKELKALLQPADSIKRAKKPCISIAESDENNNLESDVGKLRKENENLRATAEAYKTSLANTEKALERLEKIVIEYENGCDIITNSCEKQIKQLKRDTRTGLEEQLKSSAQQLSERETMLNAEKASAKELGVQTAKLRGMLKTGQDSLKQEQSVVEELQFIIREERRAQQALREKSEKLQAQLREREDERNAQLHINEQLNAKLLSAGHTVGNSESA